MLDWEATSIRPASALAIWWILPLASRIMTENWSSLILTPDTVPPLVSVTRAPAQPGTMEALGSRMDVRRLAGLRLAPTSERSGPVRPPAPFTMWQPEQRAWNAAAPLEASPGPLCGAERPSERTKAATCQISLSVIPSAAAMSEPGMPFLRTLKSALSVGAWGRRGLTRLAAKPSSPFPWQNAQ